MGWLSDLREFVAWLCRDWLGRLLLVTVLLCWVEAAVSLVRTFTVLAGG